MGRGKGIQAQQNDCTQHENDTDEARQAERRKPFGAPEKDTRCKQQHRHRRRNHRLDREVVPQRLCHQHDAGQVDGNDLGHVQDEERT